MEQNQLWLFFFFPFNTSYEVELTANHLNYSQNITAFLNTAYLISILCKFFNNYVFFCPSTQNELHSHPLLFFTCLSWQINDTQVFFTPSLAFCRDVWLCCLLWDYFTCTCWVLFQCQCGSGSDAACTKGKHSSDIYKSSQTQQLQISWQNLPFFDTEEHIWIQSSTDNQATHQPCLSKDIHAQMEKLPFGERLKLLPFASHLKLKTGGTSISPSLLNTASALPTRDPCSFPSTLGARALTAHSHSRRHFKQTKTLTHHLLSNLPLCSLKCLLENNRVK